MLIRIEPYVDAATPDVDESKNWLGRYFISKIRWLAGPIEALAKMRTTSQTERGKMETDLASTFLEIPWWLPTQPSQLRIVADTSETSSVTNRSISPVQMAPMKANLQDFINRKRLAATVSKKFKAFDASNAILRSNGETQPANPDSNLRVEEEPAPGQDTTSGSIEFSGIPDPGKPKKDRDDRIDAPVLSLSFPFIKSNTNDVIPLNWKLSDQQKKWYQEAWTEIVADEDVYFEELDLLFRPKKVDKREEQRE